jgi:cysteine-rich repeat protein
VVITHNLFHDNQSDSLGGAVHLHRGELTHNTFVHNVAMPDTASAGGVYVHIPLDTVVAWDNILAENSPIGLAVRYSNWPPPFASGHNLYFANSAAAGRFLPYDYVVGGYWSDDLHADPLLDPVTYLPGPGSPALGAASDGTDIGYDGLIGDCHPGVNAPMCGDGVRDVGEACDDGNSVAGDGCDPLCRIEYTPCHFYPLGDVNRTGTVTAADIIVLVNYVFKSGPSPLPCGAAGDLECSGQVTSADIIHLVNFVFKAGAAPCDYCSGSPLPCP